MTGSYNSLVWLTLCTGNQLLKCSIPATSYGIAVAEKCKKGFLPFNKHFPCVTICLRCLIIRCYWDKQWKSPRPCFINLIRVRSIISGYYFRRWFRDDCAFDNATGVKFRNRLRILAPTQEGFACGSVASWQK